MKKVFTTGDVARICRVTINTVVKWFDNGDVKGYRIPSSGARRIPKKELLEFMKKYNFPMDEIISDKLKILVADNRSSILSSFRKAFSDNYRFTLQIADTSFEAGLQAMDFMPDLFFMNEDLADMDINKISKTLKESEDTSEIKVVIMSEKPGEKSIKALKKMGISQVLSKHPKVKELRDIAETYFS